MTNASDFMLEEYKQMIKIYGHLNAQKNDLFRFYITIIGIGVSVITIMSRYINFEIVVSGFNLMKAISLLMFLLSVIGLIIFLSIIGLRMEMILYIRTINAVRGYFVEKDKNNKNNKLLIKNFLVLPDYDQCIPPFHETWATNFFWIVFLVAFIDSALLSISYYIFMNNKLNLIILISMMSIFTIYFLIHFKYYKKMAFSLEENYITKRSFPTKNTMKGNILGEIAEICKEEIKIKKQN